MAKIARRHGILRAWARSGLSSRRRLVMQRTSPTNRVWKEGRIVKKNLWKAGLAGILALAAMGPAPAQARMATKFRPAAHAGVRTDGLIHRMKAALKVTRLQEQYWPPI